MPPTTKPQHELPPLDYATPPPPPVEPVHFIPLIVGLAAALFGGLMLYYGAAGIVWLVRNWRRTDGEDVFEVAMFNGIGAFCTFVGVRWTRSATRRAARKRAD